MASVLSRCFSRCLYRFKANSAIRLMTCGKSESLQEGKRGRYVASLRFLKKIAETIQKPFPVRIVAKNLPSGDHMMQCTRSIYPSLAGHTACVSKSNQPNKSRGQECSFSPFFRARDFSSKLRSEERPPFAPGQAKKSLWSSVPFYAPRRPDLSRRQTTGLEKGWFLEF